MQTQLRQTERRRLKSEPPVVPSPPPSQPTESPGRSGCSRSAPCASPSPMAPPHRLDSPLAKAGTPSASPNFGWSVYPSPARSPCRTPPPMRGNSSSSSSPAAPTCWPAPSPPRAPWTCVSTPRPAAPPQQLPCASSLTGMPWSAGRLCTWMRASTRFAPTHSGCYLQNLVLLASLPPPWGTRTQPPIRTAWSTPCAPTTLAWKAMQAKPVWRELCWAQACRHSPFQPECPVMFTCGSVAIPPTG